MEQPFTSSFTNKRTCIHLLYGWQGNRYSGSISTNLLKSSGKTNSETSLATFLISFSLFPWKKIHNEKNSILRKDSGSVAEGIDLK